MYVQVNEAGRNYQAASVEYLAARRIEITADPCDPAFLDQHVAYFVHPAGGVDPAPVLDYKPFHAARIRSRTAMRTATPLSTWLRITERWESAASEESSPPRFSAPGRVT